MVHKTGNNPSCPDNSRHFCQFLLALAPNNGPRNALMGVYGGNRQVLYIVIFCAAQYSCMSCNSRISLAIAIAAPLKVELTLSGYKPIFLASV